MNDPLPRFAHDSKSASGAPVSPQQLAAVGAQRLAHGDVEAAIDAYQRCATLVPSNAAIHNNLGSALIKARRFDEAILVLETAVALQSGYQRPLVNLGKALREMGRHADALLRLRQALAIDPDYAPALVNLGDVLAACGELAAAEKALQRAITVAPSFVEARMTLGMVQLQAGRVEESLQTLHAAAALAPDHVDVHSNLAHALFCSGDWLGAWPHFEYRFRRFPHRATRGASSKLPLWDGARPSESAVCLVGEQGLGDQLQFVRYAKLLQAHGADCTLICDPRLAEVLGDAKLGVRIGTLAGTDTMTAPFDTAPPLHWFPLMSLPNWHQTRPETVPFADGYLGAEPARIERWRQRLPRARRLTVALAWAGNPSMETGRYAGRSPPLTAFAPLMNVPHVTYISLQKGTGENQLSSVDFRASIIQLPDLDAGVNAFHDTSAVLKCIDLLVTSDSAIAHLAGGLGVSVWLCLMHDPDWRWMVRGQTTPWYASMRLFRQPSPGDWDTVFSKVAEALRERVNV